MWTMISMMLIADVEAHYLNILKFGYLAFWLHARAMSMAKWGIPEKSIKNSSEGLTLGLHEAPIFFWNLKKSAF